MIDYVLKFPSEAVSVEMADAAGLIQDGALVRFTANYGIFVQGIISSPAVRDANGILLSPPADLGGWWVRVRILTDAPIPVSFERFVTDERPPGLWDIA